ncbi:hypothetical protein NE237_022374 [Protea cynaroides]|uniref:Stress enhanced protein 1 n=1 Tax=Protea cynaroides TaxID=273540 RepID=A0A9Q0K577_9MAGN|nr:hypothetical protein NE237_022374 [Protea cynaroides]
MGRTFGIDRTFPASQFSLISIPAMAQAQVSAFLCLSIRDVRTVKSLSAGLPRLPLGNIARAITSFARGSPLLWRIPSQVKPACKAASISIRCEQQGSKEGSGGLDVWLGRLAMIGFAVAITVEVTTGKGLLENFGLTSPLPTFALAITALVGILTAVFIIQSASKD